MDEADRDMELAADPFLEAGINIPKELPYQNKKLAQMSKNSRQTSRRNSIQADVDGLGVSIGNVLNTEENWVTPRSYAAGFYNEAFVSSENPNGASSEEVSESV